MRWALLAASVLLTLTGVAGCATEPTGRSGDGAPVSSPLLPCPPSVAAPVTSAAGQPASRSGQPASRSGQPATGAGEPMPDLALPCLTGGELVSLAKLGRPAVVNLWASWCQPCRKELPAFQRLADATAGDLLVLGVITGDTRSRAVSAAQDLRVSFPAVFDPQQSLRLGLARNALPVTAFVGADGRVRHVDTSGALTFVRLTELTRQHLAVEVS